MSRRLHVVYDSLGIDPTAYSEILNSWTIASRMAERERVTLVIPREFMPRLPEKMPHMDVIGVPYGLQHLPLNGGLEYTYRVYSQRVAAVIAGLEEPASVVHRLNPFGIRYGSPSYKGKAPLVLGPVGGSLYAPGIAPKGREWAIERIKDIDRIRLAMPWTLLRRTYENAAAILVSTQNVKNRLPRSVWDRCILRPEGIDTAKYDARSIPDSGTPRVLFVGRLIPYKAADILIEALGTCRDIDWALDIVGDGPERAQLERLAAERGIADRVVFHGWVPQGEMPERYAACAFCCFPSVNESVGMVNLEAMASGRAVVAADWAGPSELLADGAGVLVSPTSREEYTAKLAVELRRLIGNRELCIQMGLRGRQRVIEKYDWSTVLNEFQALYRRLANSGMQR